MQILRRLAALLLLALAAQGTLAEDKLIVYYDVRPPLVSMQDGHMDGLIGNRAMQALNQAGIPVKLLAANVTRQDKEIASAGVAACAIGRLKSAERLEHGQFSEALGITPPYVAVVRRVSRMPEPASLQRWAADVTLRWGVQQGLHYSDQIQELQHKARATVVSFVQSNEHLVRLLLAGRIDFLLLQEDEAAQILGIPELAPRLRQVPLSDLRVGERRYFYCSKQVPAEVMQRLNAAILSLKP